MEDNRTNIKVYYKNVLLCTLYDEDFEENSLEVSGSALGSNGFNIGGATSNQSSLTLTKVGLKKMRENNALRRKARFDIETFEGINNSAGYKYNLGKFYVTELEVGDYSADLVLYDGMVSFDEKISESDLQEVKNTEKTIADWVTWILGKCRNSFYQIGIDTTTINTSMVNGGITFKIAEDSRIDTYRNMLEFLSVLAGGYFKINRDGNLYLGRLTAKTGDREISELVVTDYKEDAYPCFVREIKTSVAGFDHAYGNTNVPDGYDELKLSVYENPFLRSRVTEEDNYLPVDVQNILDKANDGILGRTLSGGSVTYMSGYGKLGELGEVLTVNRKRIPYGGEEASELATSKILVTDFTYQYKNSITLSCNASVSNINPSSSGLNKGVGYKPMDRRLDTIADRLQENQDTAFKVKVPVSINKSFNNVIKDALGNDGFIFVLYDGEIPQNIASIGSVIVDISNLKIVRHLDAKKSVDEVARCCAKSLNDPNASQYIKDIIKTGGIIQLGNSIDMKLRMDSYSENNNLIHSDTTYFKSYAEGINIVGEITSPIGDDIINFNFGRNLSGAMYKNVLVSGTDVVNNKRYYLDITSKVRSFGLGKTSKDIPTFSRTGETVDQTEELNFYGGSETKRIRLGISLSQINTDDTFTFDYILGNTLNIGTNLQCFGNGRRQGVGDDTHLFEQLYNENCMQDVYENSNIEITGDIILDFREHISGRDTLLSTVKDEKSTVGIIVDAIKNKASDEDIINITNSLTKLLDSIISLSNRVDNIDADYLYYELDSIKSSIRDILERLDKLESGTTPPDITDTLNRIEESLKKLESDLGVTNNKLDNHIKSSDISINNINRSISELNERVKKLENSGTEPPTPEPPTPEPGTSSGVSVSTYTNSKIVGVSQGKTEFATVKLDVSKGVIPVLNVSANATVTKNGTLVFKVSVDGSETLIKPKFLLSKANEFISFSIPLFENLEDKIVTLSLTGITTDSVVNFGVNDIAISVINAKTPKAATSFDEKVKHFTISSSNIKLSTITENISTTK